MESIRFVSFSVFSEDQIRSISALEVKNTSDVSSPRLGTGDNMYCSLCETPEKCLGHMGHIKLNEPMFHPLFVRKVIGIMGKVCVECSRILRDKNGRVASLSTQCSCVCGKSYASPRLYKLSYEDSKEYWKSERVIVGPYGLGPKSKIFYARDVRNILGSIPEQDLDTIGFQHPENMILTLIPVVPNCVRASSDSFDYITRMYERMVTLRNKNLPVFDEYSKLLGLSEQNGVHHRSKKSIQIEAFKPLNQRLSGRSGLFRHYALGKRNNHCGRAVISPDPNIDVDEVGVPSSFFSVDSGIKEGDLIMVNRQPSLQRHSMMSFRIRRNESYVITINPAVCPAFNADFDGDEMNLFVPQSAEAIEEMDLLHVSRCILSPQDEQPVIHPVFDCISGLYLLSAGEEMDADTFADCIAASLHPLSPPDFREERSGARTIGRRTVNSRELVAYLLGDYATGEQITLKVLKKIIKDVNAKEGGVRVLHLLSSIQKAVNRWFVDRAFSIGYEDCTTTSADRQDDNPLYVCIRSGAKGSLTNATQISHSLGQQYVGGVKPPFPYLSELEGEDVCSSSFLEGLSPSEFFVHCQAGREGVVSTSMNTPVTGYVQRRLARFLEDVIQDEDGIIRDLDRVISGFGGFGG